MLIENALREHRDQVVRHDNAYSPSVSVVIPAYNAAHSIEACLRSVTAQTFQDWEAIVVDDGSTDRTAEVVKSIGDARILLESQANAGQGAARNRGVDLARGQYLAFLDADDEWRERFLERTVAFLRSKTEVIAVSSGFVVRYADGREKVGPVGIPVDATHSCGVVLSNFFEFWASFDHLRTGTALMRRSAISAAGPQRTDLRISQDLEYWAQLGTIGSWGFIVEPLWIGNSRSAAAGFRWLFKYRARRKLCPTVETWQSRIKTRLKPDDLEAFEKVRGRVAAGLLHHMIIGGKLQQARETVQEYGAAMPKSALVRLLRASDKAGTLTWAISCKVVQAREIAKVVQLSNMWSSR